MRSEFVLSVSPVCCRWWPQGGADVGTQQHVAALMQEDASFLEWAESVSGRAALAAGLRALRARAASNLVAHVLQSQEGREGLLSALGSTLGTDPGLAAQLRALVLGRSGAHGSGGGGGGGGAGGGRGVFDAALS